MDLKEFKNSISKQKSVLGFDFGTKRLGVAISDLSLTIATSYKIIERKSFEKDIMQIKQIVDERQIGGLIYGLAKQMNGIEGTTAELTRAFALKVSEKIDLPYTFWDERYSSLAVENMLIKEVDMSRSKRKKILDASAAAYILQGALDAMKYF